MKKEKMKVFKARKKKNFNFSSLKQASLIAFDIKWITLNTDKNKQSV